MLTFLRSLLFNLLFFSLTGLYAIGLCVFLPLPRRLHYHAGVGWARMVFWLLKWVCGIHWTHKGLEHLPKGPCIFAAKHQSAWDTLAFPQIVDRPLYVLKKELIRIPVFGWHMHKIGNIAVDRSAGTKAMRQMMRDCDKRVKEGHSLVIFPEGTRTKPRAKPRYQPGIAALYQSLNMPVVPVALNSGLHWGRNAFTKHPGTIELEFLEPIQPGLNRKAFMALLEERIETRSFALTKPKT